MHGARKRLQLCIVHTPYIFFLFRPFLLNLIRLVAQKKVGKRQTGPRTHLSASLRNPGPVARAPPPLSSASKRRTARARDAATTTPPHLPLTSSSRRRLAAVQCPPPPASPSPSPTPSGMRSSPRAAHPTSTYPCKYYRTARCLPISRDVVPAVPRMLHSNH